VSATTEQKVDFLLKKVGFTLSKTGSVTGTGAISGGTTKEPFAESLPSPLVVPDSSIWNQSLSIPTTPPGSDTSIVKVYSTSSALRMTADSSVSGSRAFIAYTTYNNTSSARLTDWIDTQFGTAYVLKVYKGDPNSGGTLLPAGGSGSNDGWFFDYSSGVLNFNGSGLPSGVTDSNIYIVGYRYIGSKGVSSPASINPTNLFVSGISTFVGVGTFQSDLSVAGQFKGYTNLVAPHSSTKTFTVTVATKDASHRYNGQGSGNGYLIDGIFSPILTLTPGRTYRFTNDNTGSHPLKFYLEADKTTNYTTGVSFQNTYTEITISDETPNVLHYQCTAHSLMGNAIVTNSNVVNSNYAATLRGGLTANSAKVEDLTSGRVVLAGTGGELEDNGNLTFNGSQLGITGTVNASSTITGTEFHTGASGSAIRVTSNTITGPATFTLDPAGIGTNTGKVIIAGDLQVDGTTTTVNSTTVNIVDKNIQVATGAANDAAANGGGITVDSGDGDKTFQFEATGDNWGASENLNLASGKDYKINNTSVLNATTLGSGVVNSSLTNVGTLTSLDVSGLAGIGSLTVAGVSTFTGNIDANGSIDVDGHTEVDTLGVSGISTFQSNVHLLDNDKLQIGGSVGTVDGLELYHDGSNSYISETGTGGLIIDAPNTIFQDGKKVVLGTDSDVQLYHDNSHGYISNSTGNLRINSDALRLRSLTGSENYLKADVNGTVELYYDGTKKFETTTDAILVTGVTGNARFNQFGHLLLQNTNNGTTNFWGISPRGGGELDIGYAAMGSGGQSTTIAGDIITLGTDSKVTFHNTIDVTGHAGIGSLTVAGVTTSTGGFVGNLTGNVTGTATDLAINGTNQLLYQASNNDSAVLPTGNAGQILQSNGSGNAPQWVTSAPAGAIEGITIREESTVVGSANSISTINFIGESVTADAAVAAGIATVTIDAISGILVKDGGANVGTGITAFDFAGSLVDVDAVSNTGIATVQIDGLSVKDEGSSVGTAGSITTLNFVGTGIVVDAAANAGVATITSSGGVTNADVVALAIALG